MVGPIESAERRAEIIKSAYDLNREPCTAEMLRVAVASTGHLTIPQLEAITRHVATHDQRPGTPTLRALMQAADAGSRDARRRMDSEHEPWCIPAVAVDHSRLIVSGPNGKQLGPQALILNQWKKPASQARWDEHELAALRAELEADSPALAEGNARRRRERDFFRKHGRFQSVEEARPAAAASRQPGEEA